MEIPIIIDYLLLLGAIFALIFTFLTLLAAGYFIKKAKSDSDANFILATSLSVIALFITIASVEIQIYINDNSSKEERIFREQELKILEEISKKLDK